METRFFNTLKMNGIQIKEYDGKIYICEGWKPEDGEFKPTWVYRQEGDFQDRKPGKPLTKQFNLGEPQAAEMILRQLLAHLGGAEQTQQEPVHNSQPDVPPHSDRDIPF